MYYSKSSGERLSQFAKSTKNFLLYGNTNTDQKQNKFYQVKVDPKPVDKPMVQVVTTMKAGSNQTDTLDTNALTNADLQQAIIWSEILGKPMCKRRERRNYVN
ncbi:MAG: hypothetical protein K0R46_2238 [Herbinix sp.]|jgi:hypothetical protein|nr:hypothetical protein [Herbinix sp.]